MKRKLLAVLFATTILFSLGGCSTNDISNEDDDTINIALVTKMVDSPYWQTVKEAAIEKAQELGNVEITHLGPAIESDINAQVSIVETCIVDEYDGIILAACDKDALVIPVKKAVDTGIPVVMIDSGLSSPVYDAFLSTNNVQAGANCADLMAELIGESGKVGIINFTAGTSTAIERETGFVEQIEKNYPNIELVGIQYCDSDPTKAANQATDMISAEPDIKGIWGVNDQAAIGVANAVSTLGKIDEISVVGFDNSADIIAGLEVGTIKGTAVQMPTVMGAQGVQMVIDILDGAYPEIKEIDTGVVMVNQENLNDEISQAALNQ
ncbi:hypothetical protein AN641_01450 [Candidatus Epulonipiscioides gigas]|nr:hypothetical protein AN641_01450 [Epulopiscium sp. SCG-C07WGA-EpuloA2]